MWQSFTDRISGIAQIIMFHINCPLLLAINSLNWTWCLTTALIVHTVEKFLSKNGKHKENKEKE